ncbi:MAG: glutathione peroxidase [Prevotella sp.]|nr:glutathione peroxidase [Prevotella sp.]
MATIFDFKALTNKKEELDFKVFEGKTLLIVNTASKCGFTPQFEGLEALNQKYKDQGLVVIGFPCNQFMNQDPGSDEEISGFCQINFGVTFQMMKKVDVNGENAHPIFKYLKNAAPTETYKGLKAKLFKSVAKVISKNAKNESDIQWNFTKFLISRDGKQIERFAPTTDPSNMEIAIERMLG